MVLIRHVCKGLYARTLIHFYVSFIYIIVENEIISLVPFLYHINPIIECSVTEHINIHA